MKKIIALLLALVMVFALAACGNSDKPVETQQQPTETQQQPAGNEGEGAVVGPTGEGTYERKTAEGTLTVGLTGSNDGFDVSVAINGPGMALVYDTILIKDPYTGEIGSRIAESWEYVDECTLVITFKDNVVFSNGEKLTAEDAMYSLQRLFATNSRYYTYFEAFNFEKSTAEGQVLTLVTDEPFGPGLNYLTTRYASVTCKSYMESCSEEDLWDKPVGTGPYAVVENIAGSHATYKVRDDYWGKDEYTTPADTITLRYYAEQSSMMLDYENGALDMAFDLSVSDATRALNSEVEHSNVVLAPTYDTYSIAMPEYVEAFDDIRVRQAVAHALDTEAICEAAMGVLGAHATSTVTKGIQYKIDVGSYEYNPEKSKALLEEAGIEPGELNLEFVVVNSSTNNSIAEWVEYYLGEVGINCHITSADFATAVPLFMAGETDLVIDSMEATSQDPDQKYDTVKASSTNATVRISDPEMDGYLTAGRNSVDPEVRAENYAKAQQWMYDSYRQVPITDVYCCYIYRDYITNFATVIPESPDLTFLQW